MGLAVAAQRANITIHLCDAFFKSRTDQQQQYGRDDHADQPSPAMGKQLPYAAADRLPWQIPHLGDQLCGKPRQPVNAEWLIAWHPECLFRNRIVQIPGNFAQLVMIKLRTGEDGELATQFLIQLIIQFQPLLTENVKRLIKPRLC